MAGNKDLNRLKVVLLGIEEARNYVITE